MLDPLWREGSGIAANNHECLPRTELLNMEAAYMYGANRIRRGSFQQDRDTSRILAPTREASATVVKCPWVSSCLSLTNFGFLINEYASSCCLDRRQHVYKKGFCGSSRDPYQNQILTHLRSFRLTRATRPNISFYS